MTAPNNWTFEQRLQYLKNCSPEEWESICKHCGICCLIKFDLGKSVKAYSRLCCEHLNLATKQCMNYENRLKTEDCSKVDLNLVMKGERIPANCGYSEFLYGPAAVQAKISPVMLKPVSKITLKQISESEKIENIILESVYWNRRQK